MTLPEKYYLGITLVTGAIAVVGLFQVRLTSPNDFIIPIIFATISYVFSYKLAKMKKDRN